MISLTQLEYLVAVDQHRHFGKAAKVCHVTQPTLSLGLLKLEETLGVSLFDRSMQPIIPTAIGNKIVAQARITLSEAKKIPSLVYEEKEALSGSFIIGVIPTVSPYLLPLFLTAFGNANPGLEIQVHEMTTGSILSALDHDRLDVGILALPIDDRRFSSQILYREPFYLYISSSHPLAKKRRVDALSLDGKDMWLLEEGHCLRQQVLQACRIRGKRKASSNIEFESGSLETLKRLVEQGSGYTLIPHLAVANESSQDEKGALIRFYAPAPARDVGLIYRRTQLKLQAIIALGQAIKQALPTSLANAAADSQAIPVK